MIYEYSPEIPKIIKSFFFFNFGAEVAGLERITSGEVNYSYKTETSKGPFHVRIFRYEGWPSKEKLSFIHKKLSEMSITQADIVHIDRSNRYFPYGFMVQEWIEGIPGDAAVNQGVIEENLLLKKNAEILRKIHKIKFEQFGFFPFAENNKVFDTFSSYILFFSGKENEFDKLGREDFDSKKLIEAAKAKIEKLLGKIDFDVQSRLVHADATSENTILTEEGPVLVDWDNARASCCVYDLAWLTFWSDEQKLYNNFLEVHGNLGLTSPQIKLLEEMFHLVMSLELLPYFAYSLGNTQRLEKEKERLKNLLKK
jgi:thiamine kinase-like enzyme